MEEENIIELVDDNGETVRFEHLATIEHEGGYYIALMLLDDEHQADDDEGEVIIMKIEEDEEGTECYVPVEDDALQQTVFDKFLELMDEEDDDDAEFCDAEDPEDDKE